MSELAVSPPDVTVVIPTHQRPDLLRRAIASCAQAAADVRPPRVEVDRRDTGCGRGVDTLLAGEGAPTAAARNRRRYLGDVRWDSQLRRIDDLEFFASEVLRGVGAVDSDVVAHTRTRYPSRATQQVASLDHARQFYALVDKIATHLQQQPNADRRLRLAQYLHRELRTLAGHGCVELELRSAQIQSLDPDVPRDEERQAIARLTCRVFGVVRGVRIIAVLSRLQNRNA